MPQESHQPEGSLVLSTLDSDLFCGECGYCLRGQPIRRDDRTRLLLLRCPECGRYYPMEPSANAYARDKLLKSVFAAGWLILTAAMVLGVVFGEFILDYLAGSDVSPTLGVSRPAIGWLLGLTPMPNGARDVALTGSIFLSFVGTLVVLGFCWHWSRTTRWCYAAASPLVAACLTWFAISIDTGTFSPVRAMWNVLTCATIQLAGGLLSVRVGRDLLRLSARLLVPDSLRQSLSFLWQENEPPGTNPDPGTSSPYDGTP